jgi:hypothetical protein
MGRLVSTRSVCPFLDAAAANAPRAEADAGEGRA